MRLRAAIIALTVTVAVVAAPVAAVAHCFPEPFSKMSPVQLHDSDCQANPHADCQLSATAASAASGNTALHDLKFLSNALPATLPQAEPVLGGAFDRAGAIQAYLSSSHSSLQALNCTFLI